MEVLPVREEGVLHQVQLQQQTQRQQCTVGCASWVMEHHLRTSTPNIMARTADRQNCSQFTERWAPNSLFPPASPHPSPPSYFDAATTGLDFKGLMEDITNAPDGSVILLHGESSRGA